MLAFILVLGTFVWRLRTDRPCSKQVELFKWWPQPLRTKSFKRVQAGRGGSFDSGVISPQSSTGGVGEKVVVPSAKKRKTKFGSVQEGMEYTDKEIRGAKILLGACALATFFIFIR